MNQELIISIIGLFIAAVGVIIALVEFCRSNKTRRAEFVHRIWSDIVYNKEMMDVLYHFDYSEFKYDNSFHSSDVESKVDAFLSTLSYVCYLNIHVKALTKKDLECFDYYLTRTLANKDIQAYLFNIYHFTKKCNTECSYKHLIEYGLKKKLIPKSFQSELSSDYPKVLNF